MVVREIQEGKEDNRILEVEKKGREISSREMHKFLDLSSNRTHLTQYLVYYLTFTVSLCDIDDMTITLTNYTETECNRIDDVLY